MHREGLEEALQNELKALINIDLAYTKLIGTHVHLNEKLKAILAEAEEKKAA